MKFLQYVKSLKYTEEPNYTKCKDFFVQALKKNGWKNDGKLDFTAEKKAAAAKKAVSNNKIIMSCIIIRPCNVGW